MLSSISDSLKEKLFKISWFILLLGIICDLGLYQKLSIAFFTLNVQASSIGLILYLLVFIIIVPLKDIGESFRNKFDRNIILILSLLLIVTLISSALSAMPKYSIGKTIFTYSLFYLCFIFTLVYTRTITNSVQFILKSLVYFNLFIILSSFPDFYFPDFNKVLVDYFGHMEGKHSFLVLDGIKYNRPSGFVTDSNLTAYTISLTCIILLLNKDLFKSRYIHYIFFSLGGFITGMLASRSAEIVMLFSCVVFFIFKYADRKRVIISVVIFFCVQLLTPQTQARIRMFFSEHEIKKEIRDGRLVIWSAALIAHKTSPVIGIGSYAFFKQSEVFLALAKNENPPGNIDPSKLDDSYTQVGGVNPHSIFLTMLTEHGYIGLIIFCIFLIYFFREIILKKKIIALTVSSGLLFVSSLSNYAPYYKYYLLLCIILYVTCNNNFRITTGKPVES